MKNIYKCLLLLLINIFLGLGAEQVMGQCTSSFAVQTVDIPESGRDNGKIIVNITTKGTYECRLNAVSGNGKQLIKQVNQSGNSKVVFTNLKPYTEYQVQLLFQTESELVCRKKQISEITINE